MFIILHISRHSWNLRALLIFTDLPPNLSPLINTSLKSPAITQGKAWRQATVDKLSHKKTPFNKSQASIDYREELRTLRVGGIEIHRSMDFLLRGRELNNFHLGGIPQNPKATSQPNVINQNSLNSWGAYLQYFWLYLH